ncbi:type I methionyl aminopeptidase [bacterium]|nr:type I methionyl aminopeptidase [bacterium]
MNKIGRNDPCPCGSGKKYKNCCMLKEKTEKKMKQTRYYRQNIIIKTAEEIEGIRRAGRLVVDTLNLVEKEIKPGITTEYINKIVHEYTIENNAIPAPLNYKGFPKSVCTSVNDVICHGIPGSYILKDGDIINVDITSILDGFYADASKTFFVGTPSDDAKKIVSVAKKSLKRGMNMVKPGNTLGDIGWAIQTFAESNGCSVVRDFVGHGVGINFHEPPQVAHTGQRGRGVPLIENMVFTIEPMINTGKSSLRILEDGWTAVTIDGSLSAQFEQTLVVTKTGYESLTPFPL